MQSASLPDNGAGIGGVTLDSIDGMAMATFAAFSNRLEARSTGFELVSHFTLGSTSDGINPLTEAVTLEVGSYFVTIPANSFHMKRDGDYVYEGTIDEDHLELQIVPHTSTNFTLRVNAAGRGMPITLESPPSIELMIGNDVGWGIAKLDGEE